MSTEDRLAAFLHKFWSAAFKLILERSWPRKSGAVHISVDLVKKWTALAETPYDDLPEEDKAFVREWVPQMMEIIKQNYIPPIRPEVRPMDGYHIAERVFNMGVDAARYVTDEIIRREHVAPPYVVERIMSEFVEAFRYGFDRLLVPNKMYFDMGSMTGSNSTLGPGYVDERGYIAYEEKKRREREILQMIAPKIEATVLKKRECK